MKKEGKPVNGRPIKAKLNKNNRPKWKQGGYFLLLKKC